MAARGFRPGVAQAPQQKEDTAGKQPTPPTYVTPLLISNPNTHTTGLNIVNPAEGSQKPPDNSGPVLQVGNRPTTGSDSALIGKTREKIMDSADEYSQNYLSRVKRKISQGGSDIRTNASRRGLLGSGIEQEAKELLNADLTSQAQRAQAQISAGAAKAADSFAEEVRKAGGRQAVESYGESERLAQNVANQKLQELYFNLENEMREKWDNFREEQDTAKAAFSIFSNIGKAIAMI